MKQLIFSKVSDYDLKDTIDYYNWKQLGLGDRFFDNLYDKIEKIITNPSAYAKRYENVRCVKIGHFPFMIHFIDQTDSIVIIGILHTSRNPELWKKRK